MNLMPRKVNLNMFLEAAMSTHQHALPCGVRQ